MSIDDQNRIGSFSEGLRVQVRCLSALMARDMMTRYGRANIGFLWVVLEPMILTIGVMLIWSLLKSPYEHGLQIVAIVLTGYMPLTLFRHITGVGPFIFRRSLGLLYHRHISLLDALLARTALEFLGTTTALITIYSIIWLSGLVAPIVDPGLVALGWVTMAALSFGLALVFAIWTEYSEVAERFIQPFQYLMLPLSGTFFMVEWLPKRGQDLIWYNPTVHCYEMFRAGFFGEGLITHFDLWYPAIWAIGLIAGGLSMIESVRNKLNTG